MFVAGCICADKALAKYRYWLNVLIACVVKETLRQLMEAILSHLSLEIDTRGWLFELDTVESWKNIALALLLGPEVQYSLLHPSLNHIKLLPAHQIWWSRPAPTPRVCEPPWRYAAESWCEGRSSQLISASNCVLKRRGRTRGASIFPFLLDSPCHRHDTPPEVFFRETDGRLSLPDLRRDTTCFFFCLEQSRLDLTQCIAALSCSCQFLKSFFRGVSKDVGAPRYSNLGARDTLEACWPY